MSSSNASMNTKAPPPQSPASGANDAATYDLILVGGGLQNGLIALSALSHDPARRIALIEREAVLGGNHTWCLHSRDIPTEVRGWVTPLLVHEWAGYDVRFPGFSRTVTGSYLAVTSARLSERVLQAMARAHGSKLSLGVGVRELSASSVVLEDGSVLHGSLVIDARGPSRRAAGDGCGFQKFVGLELQFEAPHQVERPIVMDAKVAQREGYRFFYVLPLNATRLLVEDTRFSPSPELDRDALREEVRTYARRFGTIASELREEFGVLPMPWRGDAIQPRSSPLIAGFRGGFFHPATGYSFHAALRMAHHIGTRRSGAVFDKALSQLYQQHVGQARYAQRLNWLLFHGFDPGDMWHVFERFYRLPDSLIHRFYALELSAADRARILLGRPPQGFKLSSALKSGGPKLPRNLQAMLGGGRGRAPVPEPPAEGEEPDPEATLEGQPGSTR